MRGQQTTEEESSVSRRGFLRTTAGAAAAGGAAASGVAVTSDDAAAQSETYRFGGEVEAWHGRAPSSIEGQDNPTIQLEAGTEYEVVWENLDGAPHDFTIQNGDGQNIVSTEQMSEQGATASMTFTASADMAQYICTVHPTTMVGDIEVSGGSPTGGETNQLPVGPLLLLGGVLMMFLSPIVFALFLFSRRSRGGERGGTASR